MRKCIVCGAVLSEERESAGALTCSAICHEALVKRCEREYGTHKRVVNIDTGKIHLVPVRDIIEKGLKGSELDQYPEVKPTEEEARDLEATILLRLGMRPEVRDGKPGIVAGGVFVPAGKPREGDVLVCALKAWGSGLPGSITSTCSQCGRDVVIAPSGQEMMRKVSVRVMCLECALRLLEQQHGVSSGERGQIGGDKRREEQT